MQIVFSLLNFTYSFYSCFYLLSRPAVPTSVINKFVIANVRWHVDAEFELHRRHDERTGVRAPGIHLVVNARDDNVFCHSLNLSKEVVSFTEVIYSAGKVRLYVLTGEVRKVFPRLYRRLILPAVLCIQHPRAVSLFA